MGGSVVKITVVQSRQPLARAHHPKVDGMCCTHRRGVLPAVTHPFASSVVETPPAGSVLPAIARLSSEAIRTGRRVK